jgi:hypothetical protein
VVYIEKPVQSEVAPPDSTQSADSRIVSSRDAMAIAQDRQPSLGKLDTWAQIGAGHEYLSLRQRVLAFGVDVLQSHAAAPSSSDDTTTNDSRYGALLGELHGG